MRAASPEMGTAPPPQCDKSNAGHRSSPCLLAELQQHAMRRQQPACRSGSCGPACSAVAGVQANQDEQTWLAQLLEQPSGCGTKRAYSMPGADGSVKPTTHCMRCHAVLLCMRRGRQGYGAFKWKQRWSSDSVHSLPAASPPLLASS